MLPDLEITWLRTILAQPPMIAVQRVMSLHPVKTSFLERVERCSIQV